MANLRKLAKGQECQVRIPGVCNFNNETTVLAHLRMSGITGAGLKANDLLGAWCCSACHQATESNPNLRKEFLEGVARTQDQLVKMGGGWMVILPFPDPALMPNRKNGKHWAVTNKIKNKAIDDAYYITKSSKPINIENGLQITFYTPTKHRRDNDNLLAAMKPYLDGFARAMGIDDTNFNPLTIKRVDGVGKDNARVEIEGL